MNLVPKHICLILALLWPTLITAHDFHVSLTEVNFNAKAKTFEVSVRLFTDDLDKALELDGISSAKLVSGQPTLSLDKQLAFYLSKHFQLKVDDRPLSFTFIGLENQLDATWCHLEFAAPAMFTSITVSNSCLMEVYNDQTNMVTCTVNGKNKSMILQKGASEKKVSF